MNRYEIRVTQKAISDMQEINDYISEELLEPNHADKLLDKLEQAIYGLETLPLKYPLVSDKYIQGLGIHKLPVENYMVFYTVSEQDKEVAIVRVLYQKRNWINLF